MQTEISCSPPSSHINFVASPPFVTPMNLTKKIMFMLAASAGLTNAFVPMPNGMKRSVKAPSVPPAAAAVAEPEYDPLDNLAIPTDGDINMARKCGFCMG
eukprot:FR738645.1.p3 GENE.FR738645.1~~FR738645.1.p3  ORF type:complete len:100 (+),score=15.06 FR738645.1:3-302(+)